MLKVENVYKAYGGRIILKDISFELNKSEKLSIIGPSGGGKSTILRIINDLETIDRGNVVVDGEYLYKNGEYNEIRDYSKKLGMVFQNYNLFPHMTVLENIVTPLINVYNVKREKAEFIGIDILKKVKLLDKSKNYPSELSGGEKQRVAVARAYTLKPKIICLDEPTSALDPESIKYIEMMIDILAKEGIAILIISHDMEFAKRVSDRIMFLDKGEIKDIINLNNIEDIEDERLKKFINLQR